MNVIYLTISIKQVYLTHYRIYLLSRERARASSHRSGSSCTTGSIQQPANLGIIVSHHAWLVQFAHESKDALGWPRPIACSCIRRLLLPLALLKELRVRGLHSTQINLCNPLRRLLLLNRLRAAALGPIRQLGARSNRARHSLGRDAMKAEVARGVLGLVHRLTCGPPRARFIHERVEVVGRWVGRTGGT